MTKRNRRIKGSKKIRIQEHKNETERIDNRKITSAGIKAGKQRSDQRSYLLKSNKRGLTRQEK